MEENTLSKLADYFLHHSIQSKLKLTFSDFVNCVQSGRWEEFMDTQCKPLSQTNYYHGDHNYSIELTITTDGYIIVQKQQEKTIHFNFGNEPFSRSKAIESFEQLKQNHSQNHLAV